ASSFNTPTLFTIANDLTKMQIETDVDEADIGRVQVGQKVSFEVDTYPGEKFYGTVNQIRLEPTVTSNVVTYTVIIDVPNPDEKLFPGMTANVNITTQSSLGVCTMSEALYFTPKQEELKQYTIEDHPSKGNKLWIKEGNVIKAISVTVGASDGVRSLILSGIKEGDEVVLGIEKKAMNEKKGVSLFKHPRSIKNNTQQKSK
ncbi:MAG TPA: efflux RND transporter periplasmic adaptor subunit, partial [Porphyromonadaceae bacterium]|nr:efflux RND transporter periplasmic adaptor subunit [Porphyromonadaceae bacterium]